MQRGDRLGKYTLEVPIARGGMGEVWRADQDGLARQVAIKILRADVQTERARALFEREAENLARLNSPHTLRILDTGLSDAGAPYIVTELLDGEDLWTRILREGPLPWREAVAIADQVLRALAEAHALNVIHRDIKPANIFLQQVPGDAYTVRVLDFGISKLIDPTVDEDDTLLPGLKGSPRYMAPEQIDGRSTSKAIDIYAMGTLLYCMVAGEPPFKGELLVVLRSQLRKAPKPLREQGIAVPVAFDAVVMRCLHKDPEVRPASVAALRALLARCDQPPVTAEDPPPSAPAPVDEAWLPTPSAPADPQLVRRALIGLALLFIGLLAWRTTKLLLADDPPPEPTPRALLGSGGPVARAPDASLADLRKAMVQVRARRPARFVDLLTDELRCDAALTCLVPADRGLRVEVDGYAPEVISPGELALHRGGVLPLNPKRR